jgi:hypothetical protein
VKSTTAKTRNSDSDEPSVDEPRRPQRAEKNDLVPGSSVSGVVSATNTTLLGLSPAVTIAGAYLGMGLASQLGFFSNANQYQNQSMVALASVVGAVKRHMPTSVRREQVTTELSAQSAPAEEPTTIQDIEAAMKLAEAEMMKCEY